MALKKYTITLSNRQEEMAKELCTHYGHISMSHVLQAGLVEYYRRTFESYAKLKNAVVKQTLTPAEAARKRVESDQAKAEARVAMEVEQKKNLCIVGLEGEVVDEGGVLYCKYSTYNRNVKYDQKLPFSQLTDYLKETQYYPDKKTVKLAIQKAAEVAEEESKKKKK